MLSQQQIDARAQTRRGLREFFKRRGALTPLLVRQVVHVVAGRDGRPVDGKEALSGKHEIHR